MKHLFQLIKKMNNQEVQYFKQKHLSDAGFLQLFEIIEKHRKKDDGQIEEKVKEFGFKNLAYLKHILLQKLLEAIVSSRQSTDEQSEILYELILIKSLREKKMISLAVKKWESLYKKCLEKGFATHIQLLLHERWHLSMEEEKFNSFTEYTDFIEFYLEHSHNYEKLTRIRQLERKSRLLMKKSYFKDEKDNQLLKDLAVNLKFLSGEMKYFDQEYQIFYNAAQSYIHFLQHNFNDAYFSARSCFGYLKESRKSFCRFNENFTLQFLKYYSDLLFLVNRKEEITELLSTLKKISFSTDYFIGQQQIIIFLIDNRLAHKEYNYDEVKKLYLESKNNLDEWLEKCALEWRPVLLGSISISAYVSGFPQKGLYFLYQYEKSYAKSFRKEILSFFYLFGVLLAYESKDYEVFNTTYHKAYMHFYRNPEHYPIFDEIMKPMRKAFEKYDNESRAKIFEKILKKIEVSGDSGYFQILFSYFDFPSWFRSKIENLSYVEYKLKYAEK